MFYSNWLCASLAGAWVTGSAFINRQTDLVEAFADEMTYHIGDEREMGLCIKEFKGKLGPKLYRESMFKVTGLLSLSNHR